MFNWFSKKQNKQKQTSSFNTTSELLHVLAQSMDFEKQTFTNSHSQQRFWVSYIVPLVDFEIVQKNILPYLLHSPIETLDDIKQMIPVEDIIITSDVTTAEEKMHEGYLIVQFHEFASEGALIKAQRNVIRNVSIPEVEFSVVGPKETFLESLEINLHLLRKRIPCNKLTVKILKIGKLSKTKIAIIYLKGIADEENVNTVTQRISEIDFDQITDSSYIVQLISDNQKSPFPQLLDTERPDRVAAILAEGKVAIIVDGSPHALIGPTTLVEFFSSFEDYFLNWYIASFFRLIRLFSVAFSVLITPIYVATLNYHYELIPKDLLGTLITSRREIPFPPILEALFLELTIELLREAGARLPTKVGQTIGIVGGIVIGTASVEAGLTSNVLLILVALAALASFTTPVYKMGNTIRLMRFPFLLFAEFWGLLGVVFCFCFLMGHLLQLTSLGRPFLEPIYPLRVTDLKDALIRLPFSQQSKRPQHLRPEQPIRFSKKKAKQKKDIDE
ncbi:GerA spore germination protein [Anoxybacillus vitaminiphilus]|uniref:GerA spore germination protein n=1 Tax=Paranoxybacillus vitaminiphilus TaxID=581036 RepID=A0A327YBV5_9BACL|nr:spore germination protein [Anoxybacillus vitaminiphilus]RAK18608.1 GerA spore germination protein [Anoxybacillus vitaminiphilus]